MQMLFAANGETRLIYDDDLAEIARELGSVEITRASHVEPTTEGLWNADMSPVGGGILGPFQTRAQALQAERNWLLAHNTPTPVSGRKV